MSEPGSDPISLKVGARLRSIRKGRKLTQRDLAQSLGLTFQQIQKYETGASRMTATKLWEAARLLGVHVSDFFEDDIPEVGRAVQPLTLDPETRDMLVAWHAIERSDQRAAVLNLVRAMGDEIV